MQKVIFTNKNKVSIDFGNSPPFILTKIGGTGCPETEIQKTKSPYQDGCSVSDVTLKERIIPINGTIIGESMEDLYAKRQYLCSIFNPKLKQGSLKYINDNGEKAIDCYPEQSPVFGENHGGIAQEFLITLLGPNPFWTDTFIEGEEISTWIGGAKFPFSFPIQLALRGQPRKVIINKGDVETPIEIKFTGPAVNPKITNILTGEFIRIKRTLSSDDTLIISTEFGNKKVEIIRQGGVKENAFNYIDLNSTFIQLQPGDNIIEYYSENSLEPSSVNIKHKNLYIGV